MRDQYGYSDAKRAESHAQARGFVWHSVSCICQDCLDADWRYIENYTWGMPPRNWLFSA